MKCKTCTCGVPLTAYTEDTTGPRRTTGPTDQGAWGLVIWAADEDDAGCYFASSIGGIGGLQHDVLTPWELGGRRYGHGAINLGPFFG